MRRATGFPRVRRAEDPISIHALHEESDVHLLSSPSTGSMLFQSTLSMRRATKSPVDDMLGLHISIHALHEESDICAAVCGLGVSISIHALHEESDGWNFQYERRFLIISIHALHEESDYIGMELQNDIQFQSTLSMRRATCRG